MGKLQILKPDQLIPEVSSSAEDWDSFDDTPIYNDIVLTLTFKYYEALSLIPNNVNDAAKIAGRAEGLKLAMDAINRLRSRAKGLKPPQQEDDKAV